MRGIDIYGISASGSAIFAQVTYLTLEHCGEKLETYASIETVGGIRLSCSAIAPRRWRRMVVKIIPLRTV